MKFILGTKEEMTQMYTADGKAFAATIVRAPANTVTQVKTAEKDGYVAVQLGFGTQKASRLTKPELGHVKDKGPFAFLREFRLSVGDTVPAVGDAIAPTVFAEGDTVVVTGTSKGKGFQGVVKRHGFSGGRRSHGQKHSEREPGSIGGGLRTRVPKGMRMAGRMGGDRITIKNLKVLKVLPEQNAIVISGAIPGHRGSLLMIESK